MKIGDKVKRKDKSSIYNGITGEILELATRGPHDVAHVRWERSTGTRPDKPLKNWIKISSITKI